ncbi:MAG: lipopolysaccharide biosynthesis protein [Crocinitomicaceae bacterium]
MKVIQNSIIYLGGSVLNKAIPFLLLPVLTKYLTPEEYGILSIFQLMIAFFSAFVGMNMSMNISKNFFKYSKEQTALMIGNILLILLATLVFYTMVTFGLSFFYDKIFSVPTNWIIVVPVISFMLMVNTMNLTILRNEEKAVLFGIFEILNTAVNMGVTILLLLAYNYGWYAQAIGVIIAYSIFFIVSLLYMNKYRFITLKLSKGEVNKVLKLSVPLIPHVLGGIVLALSDRLFIEQMISVKMAGIYSVGYTFGMVVILFTDAFIKAWSPWFYRMLSDPTDAKKKRIVKYSYLYILGTFAVAFGISIFAKYVLPYVVDDRYSAASKYIFWVAMGYAVHGVYKIFFPYLVHINKTAFLGLSTVIAAILNLIFNYFLIREYGAIGAAYATVLAFLVSAILVFWYQNKHYKMPWIK